jgi:DNA-directed RNA polymerase specialized sigma24 family protein
MAEQHWSGLEPPMLAVAVAYAEEQLARERLAEKSTNTQKAIKAATAAGYQASAIAKVLGVKRQSIESRIKKGA